MPAITATMVKELRERTDIPMMKCKEALEKCGGDMNAAIDYLRKNAGAAQDKKAGRETKAGGLGVAVQGNAGAVVLLACETDFVSGNDQFKSFVAKLAQAALAANATSVEALAAANLDGAPASQGVAQLIQRLGENIQLGQVQMLSAAAGGVVAGYNHGGRVAALVAGTGTPEALRQVAMHVAAATPAPVALDRSGVPAELVAKERSVIAESPEVLAKPEAIRPKIIEGKLGRFYKENVLLDQAMLGDPTADGASVKDWAKAKGVTITGFLRLGV